MIVKDLCLFIIRKALLMILKDMKMKMKMKMKMNLYSSQREICLGQRFITKILTDISFIHTCTYLQKGLKLNIFT